MNDLTFFQKAMVVFGACIIFFFGYYFLFSLPSHNSRIAALAEKEVLLKEQDQLYDQQLKDEAQQAEQLQTEKDNCTTRGEQMKKEFNNVFAYYYNETVQDCYVKYYDKTNNNQIAEAPIDDMSPLDTISVFQLMMSIEELQGDITYEEVVNAINNIENLPIRRAVINEILAGDIKGAQLIVGMSERIDVPLTDKADGYLGKYTLEYFRNPKLYGTSPYKPADEIFPLYGTQTIVHGANIREYPSTTAAIYQVIDPSNTVQILGNRIVDNSLWYNIRFYDTEGWITAYALGQ